MWFFALFFFPVYHSTVSSGVNSVVVVINEDFVKPMLKRKGQEDGREEKFLIRLSKGLCKQRFRIFFAWILTRRSAFMISEDLESNLFCFFINYFHESFHFYYSFRSILLHGVFIQRFYQARRAIVSNDEFYSTLENFLTKTLQDGWFWWRWKFCFSHGSGMCHHRNSLRSIFRRTRTCTVFHEHLRDVWRSITGAVLLRHDAAFL